MESKYKERALHILKTHPTLWTSPLTDDEYEQVWEYEIFNDEEKVVTAMCVLAEEVEKNTITATFSSSRISIFTKEQVEKLLQQQRELCYKKGRIETNIGKRKQHFITEDGQHFILNRDSILNAKLKI